MTLKELFPHQVEAVDAVLRVLQTPASGHLPVEGLRTQVIAATGSGKTLIAVAAAEKLGARHVLVLVPTLDLLTQTATAWREGGRTGAMVGVCSLRADAGDPAVVHDCHSLDLGSTRACPGPGWRPPPPPPCAEAMEGCPRLPGGLRADYSRLWARR
ncbi:DEAD/DEAH box helicase family protein [Streptomyces sp. NPDC055663]